MKNVETLLYSSVAIVRGRLLPSFRLFLNTLCYASRFVAFIFKTVEEDESSSLRGTCRVVAFVYISYCSRETDKLSAIFLPVICGGGTRERKRKNNNTRLRYIALSRIHRYSRSRVQYRQYNHNLQRCSLAI